ncbi:MAG: MBL fold metallo-hydrolase [Synergistaceae bacterium]|nr:MBL fold metallo-hydrolase [Synergistaceae bacterium]
MKNKKLNYSDCIEIAEEVYWVGLFDETAPITNNPYLIVDNKEAVLIDGGNRNEFSTVMLKILRTGVNPKNITRLIYQHYDPDLCGSLPHMEEVIGSKELKIISHYENNAFINCYSSKTPKLCIEDLNFRFDFSSGRRLEFIRTPYAHTAGNFITYDTKTKVLFSSDIFGGFDSDWSLYTRIFEQCASCSPLNICPVTNRFCQINGIWEFHKRVMPSVRALHYALKLIEEKDVSLIAPQHGSIFPTDITQEIVIEQLRSLTKLGIDYFLENNES